MTSETARLDADWLRRPALGDVLAALTQEGEEARAIGGAIRDTLLERKVKDIDVATTAVPQDVIRLVEAAGLKAVPTGIEHGTITVVARGEPVEVTTLRKDVATDGRRAVVRFSRDWRADALRRDFTINAMSVTADGRLFDYVGGYEDCRLRRVRFIGDPVARVREDYLRVLRFFRFHAEFGKGRLDPAGLGAAATERGGLARLSAERIWHELNRILVAPGAVEALREMAAAGVLDVLSIAPASPEAVARLIVAEAAADRPSTAVLRYAALADLSQETVGAHAERLRWSNAERTRARAALVAAADLPPTDLREARRLTYRHGPQAYTDGLLLATARGWLRPDSLPELVQAAEPPPPPFPLAGRDLVALGWRRGPAIGRTLAALEKHWIESDFTLGRDALLTLAREAGPASTDDPAGTDHAGATMRRDDDGPVGRT